ncbi:putative membrane protein (TIGR01666 family) [Marinilabilia salmonicolor]|uniref:YccS family putative transporter n=1 Tax=Marinilabilia salmonicolor TaxID=989 RepID=UPI000D4B42A1|nr:YccS family putative transporter [Marinilabilia salmonicolor]PRZ00535.1 putative membrane protein (TIGR01666 family) [Marinilabilia salmonicolor]
MYLRWKRNFWKHSDLLMAAKATIVMAAVAIPLEIAGLSFFAVTLALGVLAGALSETDDHPRGRIKSLILKVLSFGISSLSVELLRPWPLLLGIGLGLSTILFILVGGTGERYRGVTFGAILIGIYAMIGAEISPAWYWQPLLLPGGALFYGVISLILLYYRPYRLLDEQLARGFMALSGYLDEKSSLFPSDKVQQKQIRGRLALLNVEMVNTLERIKEVLNSYRDANDSDSQLALRFHYFMILQGLHERAASTHERYDLLSNEVSSIEVVELAGHTLHELSHAARKFADSLLTGLRFSSPPSLKWIVDALNVKVEQLNLEQTHPVRLLTGNLTRAGISFQRLTEQPEQAVLPKLSRDERSFWQRFRSQLSFQHPRFRYAIRLALCFWIGFFISEYFEIDKGEWIVLTILFVLQPSYSATRKRLFQRVLGTITGIVAGVLIVKLLTLPGQVLLMLTSAFFFFAWLKRQYSVSVVFITIFVLCAFNLISSRGVPVMLPRLIDTIIGAFLALGTVRFLWPQWQYKRLPGLLTGALQKNIIYLRAILSEYEKGTSDDNLEYRIARREAHQADNSVALAWQDMQAEPRKYRKFRQKAFKLTHLNHALLSFVSAFGAHRELGQSVNSRLLIMGQMVLEIFESNSSLNKKTEEISAVVQQIQELLKEDLPPLERQQFILLYNIADIGRQLLLERNKRGEEL